MNKIGVIVLVVVSAFLGFQYVVVKPFLTANSIQAAVVNKDGAALSEYVDFISVRESLNTQLVERIENTAAELKNTSNNSDAVIDLGKGFANFVVGKMLDVYVTPEGLIEVLSGRNPTSESVQESTEKDYKEVNGGYQSMNQFLVEMVSEDGDKITFMMSRRGLNWQITEILLPAK